MAVTHDWRLWQLEGDLRQAIENYFGGTVTGPWDKVIEELAAIIERGELGLESAAHLNLLLARTGADSPDTCAVCDCPYPDQAHR